MAHLLDLATELLYNIVECVSYDSNIAIPPEAARRLQLHNVPIDK